MPIESSNLLPHLVRESGISAAKICNLYHLARTKYKVYDIIQGKCGKRRTIEEPEEDLKKIQRALIPIFERYQLSPWCTAVRGGSAVQNAQRHIGAKHILKVDIKSCYPSINARHVMLGLERQANSLEDYDDICGAVHLGMYHKSGDAFYPENLILPTGAPTSPILCNIALTPLDYSINDVLRTYYGNKYIYSRYLDDMIISTRARNRDWIVKDQVEELVRLAGFRVNKKKTRWMDARDDDMVVTGVHVYETKGGIPRVFWRKIRSRLNHLAMEGKDIDAETRGCLAYIKSVDPERHDSLLMHFERRQNYASTAEQQRTGTQQILHGSASNHRQRFDHRLSNR